MCSRVMLCVSDLEVFKKFYDALLDTLGYGSDIAQNNNGVCGRYFYRSLAGNFGITQPLNGESAMHGNRITIGFKMESPQDPSAARQHAI